MILACEFYTFRESPTCAIAEVTPVNVRTKSRLKDDTTDQSHSKPENTDSTPQQNINRKRHSNQTQSSKKKSVGDDGDESTSKRKKRSKKTRKESESGEEEKSTGKEVGNMLQKLQ